MTTTVTKAIRSDAAWSADQSAMEALYGVGGYYTTLSAWEAALPASLVTADEQHTAVCYNDWPSGLNDAVTISGSVADSTRYIKVTVAAGHRHDGTPQSGFFIKGASGGSTTPLFAVEVLRTKLEWLDVENTRSAAYYAFYTATTTLNNVEYSNCIAKCADGRAFSSSAGSVYATTRARFVNCLAWGSSQGFGRTDSVRSRYNAYNCTAVNCAIGFGSGSTNKAAIKNCVAYGSTTIDFENQVDATNSDYNASSDTSANVFANYVTGIDSTDFIDAAGGDFHLASGSALIGVGSNLYSLFTDDIDGDIRPSSGAWDIGFDHYTAAASAVYSDLADAYSISASTSTDLSDSYAIRAAIASDLADAYAIRAAASSDLSDSYFLRAAIAADLADSYSVRAAVLADLSDAFGISAAVASDLLDAYLIRATATTDLADTYSIAAAIAADLADSYEILSSGVVMSDLSDSYAIRAAVSSEFADSYSIRAGIVSDLADSYAIRTAATSDLSDTYAIIVSAGADLADSYVIRAAVATDLVDGYSIGDAVALPCPSAEEIADAVWSHASGSDIAVKLSEAWGRLGLDPSKPVTQGDASISFGAISLALAIDGAGNGTITRS